MDITNKLFYLQDCKYKDFSARLMPTVDADTVIGVRIPELRRLAKELQGTAEADAFLKELPHRYYEENNLHAFLIAQIKDFEECVNATERFLPYVDNWATCDGMRPKVFGSNTDKLSVHIEKWIKSSHTYTVRFGIEMLMVYYLDELFDVKYIERVAEIKSCEYYINMMIAWYIATALSKQWDAVIHFIEQGRFCDWVHNKAIQKAIESRRITNEQKEYLKKLKKK